METLETGILSGMETFEIEDVRIGFDKTSVVMTCVADTSEFMTIGLANTSVAPVTAEQISARAWSCAVLTSGIIIEEELADDVVGEVNVNVMQVLIEGIIGGMIGAIAACGCGFTIIPKAFFSWKKSGSHSRIAFLKATRG